MARYLIDRAKDYISQNPPNVTKDQFFLINNSVINKMIQVANISNKDRVLEVGTGLGFLTEKLAIVAKEVVSIEIDTTFKNFLGKMPANVKIIFGDAYKLLNDNYFRAQIMPITKSVSGIPYSQAQNLLHNYTSEKWYLGDLVWLAPVSLADKINHEPILGAYFQTKIIETVPDTDFFPQPNTKSAIIFIKRLPYPKLTGDFEMYFRRWLYKHEKLKVKNALREGIINAAYDLKGIFITKNQATEIIEKLNLPQEELEKLTNNIKPDYYFYLPQKLENWFKGL